MFYWFAIGGAIAIAPFLVAAFHHDTDVLALTALVMELVFIVDAAFLHFGKRPPVPPVAVFIPVVTTISVGITTLGVVAVFWTYPSLMLFQFILTRRTANYVSLALVLVIGGVSAHYLGMTITIRIVVTLLLTMIFANVFVHVMTELQRRLHDRAILDPLTGIPNRRHFEECVDRDIASSGASGRPFSLLLIDVDQFKSVNDTMGHATGDQVLVSVGDSLRDSLRDSDLLFRIGGDEFVVLLPNTNRETASLVAEGIRTRVAEGRILAGRQMTISIGLDAWRPNDDRGNLLGRCDAALYRAKARGRNRVEHAAAQTSFPNSTL